MEPDNLTPGDAQENQAPPAAPQAAIPVADLSGALVEAYRQISAGNQQRPIIQDPIDAMTPEQREALNTQFLTDPLAAARTVANMGARAERARLNQDSLPLFQSQANMIVEIYKSKKQRSDPRFAKIEPLFDKLMVGVDTTPLVNMNEATRTHELDMRWKMAKSDILEMEDKNRKPEPLPMGGGGAGPQPNKVEDDPWMANMASAYGFTPEQMKELEGLNA